MNFRTTLILLIAGVAVGAAIWKRELIAEKVGLSKDSPAVSASTTTEQLGSLRAENITSISVRVPGNTPVELTTTTRGGPLELPGNWPVRRNEVAELIGVITNLKSRFQPVSISDSDDLSSYGLSEQNNQSPVLVEVATRTADNVPGLTRLRFGQSPTPPGANPFLQPAYVRINDEKTLYVVGQETLAALSRPLDFYRKRQVFPEAERVKVADGIKDANGAQPLFILKDVVKAIQVNGPNGGYFLTRISPTPKPTPPLDKPTGESFLSATAISESWRLASPVSDHVDPVKLKNILTAIPDLWVEQFITNTDPLSALANFAPLAMGQSPLVLGVHYTLGFVQAEAYSQNGPFLQVTGLKNPPMSIVLTLNDGTTRTLLIGKVSRTTKRTEPAPPPMIPGQPPSPPKVIEEPYYFAKLLNTPLVFEVKGERLKDVFLLQPPPEGPKAEFVAVGKAHDQLRDGNVVRFDSENVTAIEIKGKSQTLALKKTKKDPKAESEAARVDRWDLTAPFTGLAEAKQVNDLLDPLEKLSAKRGDIIDRTALHAIVGSVGVIDLSLAGLTPEKATIINVSSDEKSKVPTRTILVGNHDQAKKKFFVWSPETPNRINVVDDTSRSILDRQARAYRALKLFDLGDDRVESIRVVGAKGPYAVKEAFDGKKTFQLTEPVSAETDGEKAAKLLADLGSLEATEFVYDPPSNAEMAAIRTYFGALGDPLLNAAGGTFGLDQPAASVTLNFAGPKPMASRQLHIGKARDGKPEFFAKLDGSPSVFSIKKEVADILLAGSLGLLPTQLWNGSADGLSIAEIARGKEAAYTLKQTGSEWKLTSPFAAAVDAPSVNPMATALSSVKAERYEAHVAKSLTEYGLDQPSLRVKFTLTERTVNKPGEEPKETTKERVLLIGKSDGKSGRFAKLDGDANPAVFVIADKAVADLDKPALELLNKKLLSLNPSAVTKLDLAGPDGPISLEKQGNDWKPVGAVFPVDRPTVDQLIRYLGNLTALKFADFGPNIPFAKYGLDAASKPVTIKVSLGSETHTLEIGKVAEGTPNDRYMRVDGGNAVGVLAVTTARDLSKGRLELADRGIFKFDPIDLQAIRRTSNSGELELSMDAANWAITKPTKATADLPMLEELTERLGNLRAERIADLEGKELAKFGLAQPTATVKLEMIGKGAKTIERTLKIGAPVDPTKPEGERFAQADGASTIVVLSAYMSKRLLAEPIKFRDRNLASFVTADKAVVTRNGKETTFEKVGGAWKLRKPSEGDAEDEGLRDLIDLLAKLRADEIVAEKPADLKQYGLDQPDRWKWFNGDKEVLSLLVGSREKTTQADRPVETLRTYAKLEKSDTVVLLDFALSTKLRAEYRKRALWEPLDVANATLVEIDTAEGTGSFKLIKGPSGWIDPTNPSEKIDTAVVTDFLDAFAGLKADQFIEIDPKEGSKIYGLDPARRTITVATQGNQSRTITLGRLDEQKRVYGQTPEKSRKEVFVLSTADTAKLNKERSGFFVAPPKPEPKKEEPKKAEPKKEEPKKMEPKVEPKKVEPKKEETKQPKSEAKPPEKK